MSSSSLNLQLNPNARISISDAGSTPSFLIEAPIKGASLSSVRVCANNFPGAHAFLCAILIDGHKTAEIGEHAEAELRQTGVFAPADAMPEAVAYRFPLRDRAHVDSLQIRSSAEVLGRRLPLRMPAEWSDVALQFEPHHHGSVWAPVRVDASAGMVGLPDSGHQNSLSPAIPLDDEETRTHFETEGYATLINLLPTEHVLELGQFFQKQAAEGFLSCDINDGMRRFVAHNHPVARFWHDQLNERVSQLAGRRTKPSYAFVSLYLAGGDLFWHTDRPPCEYTIALLLHYAPLDADGKSPWALQLKGRDGQTRPMHQRVGEALIFRGRELMHGRDVLPIGHRSASLFFHFVNEDYDGEME